MLAGAHGVKLEAPKGNCLLIFLPMKTLQCSVWLTDQIDEAGVP